MFRSSVLLFEYTTGGIHSPFSKAKSQPLLGWTGRWSRCCQPFHSQQLLVQSFASKRMDHRSLVLALKPSYPTTSIWEEYMGGVDRGDQLRGYYSCRTKSRKFYKCIFYFLLDTAITNVFVLYKHYAASPKHKTMQDFRVRLANELIGDYCSHRRAGRQGSLLKSPPIVTGNDVPDV